MNSLNTLKIFAAIGLAFAIFPAPAAAVSLSDSGSGQALIYPYYTVNAGQQSQLSLVNRSDAAKAVKLVVREGVHGHAVFALDVYLAPHDTWTGTLFEYGQEPALITDDAGCTVPDLHADALPALPDGRHYLRPNTGELTGGEDAPTEGYAVAIEMGELQGDSAKALKPDYQHKPNDTTPAHCDQLVAAWQQGGYWRKNASIDIGAPGGGLSGSAQLIDVPHGALFRVKATALDHFRVASMHTAPDNTLPDLGSALSDAATGMASALIRVGNHMIRSDYPAERTVDAVTAALMAEDLDTDFDFRRSIGARTNFVFTMPTKRFYVAGPDAIVPPFGRDEYHQMSERGTLCPVIFLHESTYDGSIYSHAGASLEWPERIVPKPCYATSVYALDSATRPHSLLGSQLTSRPPLSDYSVQAGSVTFSMNAYDPACYSSSPVDCMHGQDYERAHLNVMRSDLAGRQYFGLPVVGFAATGFVNSHAGGLGIVGNYTYALPFNRGPRVCVQGGVVGGCI